MPSFQTGYDIFHFPYTPIYHVPYLVYRGRAQAGSLGSRAIRLKLSAPPLVKSNIVRYSRSLRATSLAFCLNLFSFRCFFHHHFHHPLKINPPNRRQPETPFKVFRLPFILYTHNGSFRRVGTRCLRAPQIYLPYVRYLYPVWHHALPNTFSKCAR